MFQSDLPLLWYHVKLLDISYTLRNLVKQDIGIHFEMIHKI